MRLRVLLLLLVSAAAARAEATYVVDRQQSLISVEVRGLSAVSRALAGRIREVEGGALRIEAYFPLSSFVSDRGPPADMAGSQDVLFEGTSERPGKEGKLRVKGNLTLHGTTRPVEMSMTLTRVGTMAFGHAYFVLHLRDYGFPLPAGMPDETGVHIDAALRQDKPIARG